VDQGDDLGRFGLQQLEERLARLVAAGFHRGRRDRVHRGDLVDEHAPDSLQLLQSQLLLGINRPGCRDLRDLTEIHSPPDMQIRTHGVPPMPYLNPEQRMPKHAQSPSELGLTPVPTPLATPGLRPLSQQLSRQPFPATLPGNFRAHRNKNHPPALLLL
jgi:hypothetical protein